MQEKPNLKHMRTLATIDKTVPKPEPAAQNDQINRFAQRKN